MKYILCVLAIAFHTIGIANEMTKNEWMNFMRTAFPATVCQKDTIFIQCFSVSINECQEVSYSSTNICLMDVEKRLPDKFKNIDERKYWAGIVGVCAANSYGAILGTRGKIIESEDCKVKFKPIR